MTIYKIYTHVLSLFKTNMLKSIINLIYKIIFTKSNNISFNKLNNKHIGYLKKIHIHWLSKLFVLLLRKTRLYFGVYTKINIHVSTW